MKSTMILCCLLLLIPLTAMAQWQPDGMPVCTADDDQWNPQVLADDDGGVFLIWHDYRIGSAHIYAQHLDRAGLPLWAVGGAPVCVFGSAQWDPQFVSDGEGGIIAAWRDNRLDAATVYAQRISAAGAMMWAADGVAMSDTYASADYVRVEPDNAGGAIVVWTHEPPAVASDILAQRVDADGTLLWGAGGAIVCNYADDQYKCRSVEDGAGGVIVCWQDLRGDAIRVYAQRLNASGVMMWPSYGVPVCPETDMQFDPKICPSTVGEAIVTWTDARGLSDDIYVQHLGASGSRTWGLSAKAICTLDEDQSDPAIVRDNNFGAIIAWKDERDDSGGDIYAQRIERDGDLLWSINGVSLNNDPTMVRPPLLCRDRLGGAVASWSFWAGSETTWDLAAQRVDAQGVGQWGSNGLVVSAAERDQQYARQAADVAGTVIFAWQDSRNGAGNDIYAHRVFADGTILSIDGGEPDAQPPHPADAGTGLHLYGAYPNPFNPVVRIEYELDAASSVKLAVYDTGGRLVKTVKAGVHERGRQSAVWRGRDQTGRQMPSGAYYYRLSTETAVRTGKLILAR